MKKNVFKRRFARQVLTRLHMSLLLLGTAFSGLVFSKLLLLAGLDSMVIRYIVVLVCAYLCFLLLMRLWLSYLTAPERKRRSYGSMIDAIDSVSTIADRSSSSSAAISRGLGGEFGGAGAGGSWEVVDVSGTSASEVAGGSAELAGGASAEVAGEAALVVADEKALILVPFALLLLVVFGGAVYLVYQAPAIISEAAFEFVLAARLTRSARKMDSPDWLGSVFRTTLPALLFSLVVVVVFALAASSYCPDATKLSEVFEYCFQTEVE